MLPLSLVGRSLWFVVVWAPTVAAAFTILQWLCLLLLFLLFMCLLMLVVVITDAAALVVVTVIADLAVGVGVVIC